MSEINITAQANAYFNDTEPMPLTGSVMQLGSDAAEFTWRNALEANETYSYVDESNLEHISNYFNDMGMTLSEEELKDIGIINAILIQHIDLELKENDIDDNDGTYEGEYTPIFRQEDSIYIYVGN